MCEGESACTAIYPTLPKGRSRDEHRFPDRKDHFWRVLVDGRFNHFKNLNYMSEYAKAKGTPSPKVAVAGTGVILLVGGLSVCWASTLWSGSFC